MILGNYFIKLVFERKRGHWQEAFAKGSVSSDPLQALRILICLLRVIGQTLRIHPIEYTDTTYQLD